MPDALAPTTPGPIDPADALWVLDLLWDVALRTVEGAPPEVAEFAASMLADIRVHHGPTWAALEAWRAAEEVRGRRIADEDVPVPTYTDAEIEATRRASAAVGRLTREYLRRYRS